MDTILVGHGPFFFDGARFTTCPEKDHHFVRATREELRGISDPRGQSDYDLLWYQAQLLHFGLPSSSHKPIAKMRLFEAFQDGTLTVPTGIVRVEQSLRREWRVQFIEGDLGALHPETGATAEATIAPDAPGPRLGSPFRFQRQFGDKMGFDIQSQKRKAGVSPDPQQQKKPKFESGELCPVRDTTQEDGCYGVSLSSHFNHHKSGTMPQDRVPLGTISDEEVIGGPITLHGAASEQTGCQINPFFHVADQPTGQTFPGATNKEPSLGCVADYQHDITTSHNLNEFSRARGNPMYPQLFGEEFALIPIVPESWISSRANIESFRSHLTLYRHEYEVWGELCSKAFSSTLHGVQHTRENCRLNLHYLYGTQEGFGPGHIKVLSDGEINVFISFAGLEMNFRGQRIFRPSQPCVRSLEELRNEWENMLQ